MPGYEFTPEGVAPIGAAPANTGVVPAGAFVRQLTDAANASQAQQSLPHPAMQAPQRPQVKRAAKPTPTVEDLKPGDVVRMAKKRIRQLKKELKRHEKLKSELAELQRLVDAAEHPPAPVRAIRATS